MENYAYTSSYAESGESSPRSRDENTPQAWDDQSVNYKVKFMCSYRGKILPRPHDNQLSYVGGETKILAVDRFVKFNTVMAKLTVLCDGDVCFKYQLPGEDLDALISVTNDDDLEHMMHEYDRLNRGSNTPARLRLFLFPVTGQSPALTPVNSFGSVEVRSDRERFMDAVNYTPPSAHGNGTDKGMQQQQQQSGVKTGDHQIIAQEQETAVTEDQIQKHIYDLQKLQIAEEQQQQQVLYRKPSNDNLVAAGDYYISKMNEKVSPVTGYQISGGYTASHDQQQQQPVYMIQPPGSMYQSPMAIPVSTQVNHGGQGYYVQRMPLPTDQLYREQQQQQVYNVLPPAAAAVQSISTQQTTVSAQQQFLPQTYAEGYRMVQSTTTAVTDQAGYGQVAYDPHNNGTAGGRQIYYTTQAAVLAQPQQQPLQPTHVQQQYQAAMAAAAAGALNQENGGKVVVPGNIKDFMGTN